MESSTSIRGKINQLSNDINTNADSISKEEASLEAQEANLDSQIANLLGKKNKTNPKEENFDEIEFENIKAAIDALKEQENTVKTQQTQKINDLKNDENILTSEKLKCENDLQTALTEEKAAEEAKLAEENAKIESEQKEQELIKLEKGNDKDKSLDELKSKADKDFNKGDPFKNKVIRSDDTTTRKIELDAKSFGNVFADGSVMLPKGNTSYSESHNKSTFKIDLSSDYNNLNEYDEAGNYTNNENIDSTIKYSYNAGAKGKFDASTNIVWNRDKTFTQDDELSKVGVNFKTNSTLKYNINETSAHINFSNSYFSEESEEGKSLKENIKINAGIMQGFTFAKSKLSLNSSVEYSNSVKNDDLSSNINFNNAISYDTKLNNYLSLNTTSGIKISNDFGYAANSSKGIPDYTYTPSTSLGINFNKKFEHSSLGANALYGISFSGTRNNFLPDSLEQQYSLSLSAMHEGEFKDLLYSLSVTAGTSGVVKASEGNKQTYNIGGKVNLKSKKEIFSLGVGVNATLNADREWDLKPSVTGNFNLGKFFEHTKKKKKP